MNPLGSELTGYLLILAVALVAHEPWRWLGAYFGQSLQPEDEVFIWVRAVSTALIAGLVMRLVLFPQGGLGAVPLSVRSIGLAIGIGAFYASRKSLLIGIFAACTALSGGAVLFGASIGSRL